MTGKYQELYNFIESAASFDEVRSSGLLPDPDSDDGYYFVSYCHKDYKHAIKDIALLGEAGARLWYDRGLESGKSWIGEVKQKISSYYCKGVIFYISKNYLNSPSCLMELNHFLGLISKSALFVTVDTDLSDDGTELDEALRAHGYDTSALPFLSDGGLFLVHEKLSIDASTEEKLNACNRFIKPELIQYSYNSDSGNKFLRILKFFMGKFASVSGLADKNVQRVDIPSHVNLGGKRYRVIGILTSAFTMCDMLEEVTVSKGWLYIENSAFVRCPSLKRVVLGKPFRILGQDIGIVQNIFDRCPNASLVYQGKIKYNGTFKGRDDITVATHSSREGWIGDCFAGCKNLTRAVLGRYDNFGDKMFLGCSSLTEIIIPKNNVTFNLNRCFDGCSSLTSITLPNLIRKIDTHSFRGCTSLREIHIPAKVKEIARDAFSGCDSIETVTIDARNMYNYDDMPYHRSCLLDELFPSAKSFYLRRVPKNKAIFVGDFVTTASDKRGYIKYIRRSDCE